MRSFLLALSCLTLALVAAAPAQAGEHRLGVGLGYWTSLEDLENTDVEESGVAPSLTYQYAPGGIFRLEVDLEYYPDGFGGATSSAYSPMAFVLVEFGLYVGVGAGVTVADDFDSNVSDPFYVARLGWDFQIIPRLHFDLNASYRANSFEELEQYGDYDTDAITFGAAARVSF